MARLAAPGHPRSPEHHGRPPRFTDLDKKLADRNRAICVKAGVTQGPHLDACMIDVAMIGPEAAKSFVGRPDPIAVGDQR
ncbi:hypothetical protein MPL3365_130524 [Mesorhizobium plurifarium]|uniref:Uncharacterized protein n=1 Tax=Mesorhizobium plurifarium TaxID=69974 RepID=A0A090FWW1_MESPL|nr:hypothetical protein MPL3365_130524 [Mesorhizobium plurifarium]